MTWRELSANDIKAVQSSWSDVVESNLEGFATNLFATFLTEHPQHAKYFKFGDNPAASSPEVKAHGTKVLKSLRAMIGKLDDGNACMNYIEDHIERHKHRNISGAAYDDVKGIMLKLMTSTLGDNAEKTGLLAAWNRVLTQLFSYIQKK